MRKSQVPPKNHGDWRLAYDSCLIATLLLLTLILILILTLILILILIHILP